jgi:hypothetical protein
MSTFVYFTENCRSDTITHGIMEDVERLKQRIENTHSTSMFDPFPAPYLVKKKFGKYQCRLIAELRTVEDHAVIIFLAVLIRGGHDYKSFSDNPNNYGQQHFNHLVSDEEITKFVEESTREPETLPKCEPSDGECGLLYGAFAIHKNSATEDLVCETHRWVEQVTEERIKKQLVLLCNPCLKALSKAHGLHFVHVPDKPNWGVWVLRSEKRLLLITLVTDANADEAKNFAENIRTQLEGKDTMTVLRFSRRAYPAIVLADDDLWIDLESETVANMALSPEESEVLESARGTDNPFPLFINGRAGSGKSTILQYLFADLLYYFLNRQGEIQEPPLYLTANGELLRMARSFVERLLSSEATFNEDSTPSRNLVNGNREILGKAFCEFQPHLLSLLSPEERSQYFAHNARVDYARFRRMWLDHFKRDNREVCKLGPDLSWHVIRSYIKGMSSETELDPDDYIELPENQITVTHEAYKLVPKSCNPMAKNIK